jgi:aspartate aminotransferase
MPYAQAAKEQGVKIFHLNIGDPDLNSPAEILAVLRNWPEGPVRYTHAGGEPVLIEALLAYYQNLGFGFLQKQDFVITNGGSEAISMFFYCACAPGDEVLVFEPFYTNYATLAYTSGIKLVAVPTELKDGFHLPERKKIEEYISPKTKAILYSSPGNPTGTVYTDKEVAMLVEIAVKHKILLAADEVYREFNFSGQQHASILKYLDKYPEELVLIDSLSKRYSLCGARVGNIVTKNQEFIKAITKLAQVRLSGDMLGQISGAALTRVPEQYLLDLQREYQARRDLVYRHLKKIPGVTVTLPEGAFYFMAGLPVADAEAFCIWLLEKFRDNNETVMFAPARGFYQTPGRGINEVRIAYVLKPKELERSLEILAKALKTY